MSEAARILATESLAEAKAALATFAEEVDRAMAGVDAEIHRTTQWLQHERPAHWKREVRARETAVQNAKSAIARKQIIAAPEPASVVDERKALDRAKRRLAEAQGRQDLTHRWAVSWERQSTSYKGAAHQLREMVGGRIPAAIARLSAMTESIEAYLSVRPTTAAEPSTGSPTEPSAEHPPASAAEPPAAPNPPS